MVVMYCARQGRSGGHQEQRRRKDHSRGLNCIVVRVHCFGGSGRLRTLQSHDQEMIDAMHVAWFWARLRESALACQSWHEDGKPHLFFRVHHDLYVFFPVIQAKVNGLSAGAVLALGMLLWKTNCSFAPRVAVTGELTLSGKLRLIGGVKEKMRPVRMGQLRRAIFPRENEAAIEKLGLSESERAEQVGLAGDMEELVRAVVQGGESLASAVALPLPHDAYVSVDSLGPIWTKAIQPVEVALVPGTGEIRYAGLDEWDLMHKTVLLARTWLDTSMHEVQTRLREMGVIGASQRSSINWELMKRRRVDVVDAAVAAVTEEGEGIDMLVNLPASCREDTFRHGVTVALAMVALSFSLPVPSDLVIYGNICSGALIISADQVPEEQMLRTCVKAGKAMLLLPEVTRRGMEVAIDEDDLTVYNGTLQVKGIKNMYDALEAVFGGTSGY